MRAEEKKRTSAKLGIAAAALAAVSLFTALAFAGPEAPSVSPRELHELRQGDAAPLVLDVRSKEEFAAGHIPGAVHIPYREVGKRIAEIDASNGVAVYCRVGPRARKGEAALLEAGVSKVLHVEGGYTAWQKAGLPTEIPD